MTTLVGLKISLTNLVTTFSEKGIVRLKGSRRLQTIGI